MTAHHLRCFAVRSALALTCLLALGPLPPVGASAVAVASMGNKQCTNAQGVTASCGPGNDQCNASQPPPLPRYHVIDYSCGENDPNGPCYDPKHKVYHLFYQDHLGIGGGVTWGHVVSRDLTKWARVGVGLWNDEEWDSTAIYSGSCMNSVHGRMTLIYPGVCKKGSSPACLYGTTVGLAVAADPDDPLSRNFTKKFYDNPIAQVNGCAGPGGGGPPGSGGDSSAAWQNTTTGEWRFLTRDKEYSNVWSSTDDFKTWKNIGPQPGFTQGACPSFFPLPKATPGAATSASSTSDGRAATAAPDHVYMYSDTTLPPPNSHRTVMVAGSYVEKGEGVLADWAAFGGPGSFQIVDNGTYYAAKDFYDPVKDRRILWGWAQISNGAQALPRHVTWHSELSQLVFSPLAEQEALRVSPPLLPKTKLATAPNGSRTPLGPSLGKKAAQAEVIAVFPMPKVPTVFGVSISASLEAYVSFSPNPDPTAAWKVEAGLRPPSLPPSGRGHHNSSGGVALTRYMPHTDLLGGDYNKNASTGRHLPAGTDPKACQAECDKASECVAWTYVIRGKPAGSGDCCLKKHAATGHEGALSLCPKFNEDSCTSGVKAPTKAPATCGSGGHAAAGTGYAQALTLLPTDKEIELRLFTDHTICEAFFMGGRVALTSPLAPAQEGIELAVFSEAAKEAIEVEVEAWSVGEIWVTPEQVADGSRW